MKQITKEAFYREIGKTYQLEDPEALIRYKRAIEWMDLSQAIAVREVGCKFAVIRDLLARLSSNVDYAAVDIDVETLRKIPGYDPRTFVCHNVNSGLPFEDACADYLLCLEVLE